MMETPGVRVICTTSVRRWWWSPRGFWAPRKGDIGVVAATGRHVIAGVRYVLLEGWEAEDVWFRGDCFLVLDDGIGAMRVGALRPVDPDIAVSVKMR